MIGPGTLTGTFTGPTVQFTGEKFYTRRWFVISFQLTHVGRIPATLVEGPFDALLGGSIPGGPAFSYSCAISTSQANCQLVVSDQTMTETTGITEIVTPFVVQGGDGPSSSIPGTGPPSPTPTPKPVDNSSSFPKAPTAATPTSDLPAQPTETLDNSAHFHTKPKHHMSWVWLVLGLMNVFHNIT